MRHQPWPALGIGACIVGLGGSAQGAESQAEARLGLEGTLVAREVGTLEFSDSSAPGGKVELNYQNAQTGLLSSTPALLVGGTLSSFVFGSQLMLDTRSLTLDAAESREDSKSSTFAVLPYLGLGFGPRDLRGVLSGTLGYRSTVTVHAERDESGTNSHSSSRVKNAGAVFAVNAGLHAFLSHNVSLDPTLSLLAATGSSERTGTTGSFTSFAFVLSFGISAWLGRTPSQPPPPMREATPSRAGSVGTAAPETRSESFITRLSASGVVSRSVRLENGARWTLEGTPETDGSRARFRLVLTGPPPPGLQSWLECTTLAVLTNTRRYPVERPTVSTSGVGRLPTLQGEMPVAVLMDLLDDQRRTQLEVCGVGYPLDTESRAGLRDFLGVFRGIAEREQVWDPSWPAVHGQPAGTGEGANQASPDTPNTDTPSTDTPSTDTPSTDTPSTDTPSTDTAEPSTEPIAPHSSPPIVPR